MENKQGFGALESQYDPRTIIHPTTFVAPLKTGGIIYAPEDHLNQWYVGICTAMWIIQNRKKANKKDYSWDFQYLLQKKYFDLDWQEGSSIFSTLKVGKNFGFLPAELWTHTTIEDLKLPYSQYIAKLQAIPDVEVKRLIALCVDKIPGYAQVDISDSQTIAKAILDSEFGIGCRFVVGPEWYSPSNPLLPPTNKVIGAHAIGMTWFNYVVNLDQKLANTWGLWNGDGNADVDFNTYRPTEAWIILKTAPVIAQPTIKQGSNGDAVKLLQIKLNTLMGSGLVVDGGFGAKTKSAVVTFQQKYRLVADGIVGKNTWQAFDMIDIITKVCNENGVEPVLGTAVACCESNLNPKATLYNKPSNSTDRGLFQWNSKYHPEISDAQAFDPKQATEFFCQAVKGGHLHDYWSASQPNWKKMLSVELLAKYQIN